MEWPAGFEDCACHNVRKAARAITQHYDRVLKSSGLKVTQLSLLAVAAKTGPLMISELGDRMVMERTTVARNLKILVERGYVTVEPGDDSRTRLIRVTAAGEKVLKRALPLWQEAQARMIEGIGRERFRELLGALSVAVETAHS